VGRNTSVPHNCTVGKGTVVSSHAAPVQCRERLGGVLKFYYREAA
jgi:hypothetical protein